MKESKVLTLSLQRTQSRRENGHLPAQCDFFLMSGFAEVSLSLFIQCFLPSWYRLACAFLRSTRNRLSAHFRKQTKAGHSKTVQNVCSRFLMICVCACLCFWGVVLSCSSSNHTTCIARTGGKDRAVDLAAALATAATAAAALPLVH